MSFGNFLKQLKRRFRARKRWLTLGTVLPVVVAAALGVGFRIQDAYGSVNATVLIDNAAPDSRAAAPLGADPSQEAVWREIREDGDAKRVTYRKVSLCGVETRELGVIGLKEIERFRSDHPAAALSLKTTGAVVFTESIDDLTSDCSGRVFFGVDRSGNLTLFDGLPDRDKVLRTFFQLDIGQLKSSLPRETLNQLYGGIRVSDKDEYNSVISTFSDYAVRNGK